MSHVDAGGAAAGREGADAVRPLTAADAAEVARLEVELFGVSAWTAGMVHEELTGPGRWYVGVDGSPAPAPVGGRPGARRLAGYAGLWFDGDDTQVMTIGVALAAQRRGLGTVLLDALVARSRELGAGAVLLEVRVDNGPAIALYERTGFVVLGRRRRYYQPEGIDAWTMRLPLDGETGGAGATDGAGTTGVAGA